MNDSAPPGSDNVDIDAPDFALFVIGPAIPVPFGQPDEGLESAITESTAIAWTRLDELQIMFGMPFGDRQLVLSEPLIRVSVFLGAFRGCTSPWC